MHPVMPLAAPGSAAMPVSAMQAMLADIALAAQAPLAGRPRAVAGALARHLADPTLLAGRDCPCAPESYTRHLLHADPAGAYAVVALVWRPGQITRIHDHITWCTFGVIQGVEHEELFDADLNLVGRSANHVGDVSGFAPPGDIHRVHNIGSETAISIHVYGTDMTRIGSSARRYYD